MVVRCVSRLCLAMALLSGLCLTEAGLSIFGAENPPQPVSGGLVLPSGKSAGIPYPGSDGIPDRLTLPAAPLIRPTGQLADDDNRPLALRGQIGPTGEYATQQALLLAWIPFNENARPVQIEIARLACPTTQVIVIAPDEKGVADARHMFEGHGVPLDNVTFLESPVDTPWIRDYGPFPIRNRDGLLTLIDAPYGDDRQLDDGVPARLASHFDVPLAETGLIVEGGNLLSNGDGLLVCSTRMISDNQEHGHSLKEIRSKLIEQWHARDAVFVDPIAGEATGHVDMLLTFPNANTVIVGEFGDDSSDAFNRQLLNETAERMASVRLPGHRNLKVERLPMPPQPEAEFWPTYCNVVYANGVLLIPFYSQEDDSFRRAAEVYRRVLPGWRIAGIDCSEIIRTGGALHCLTASIPADGRLSDKPLFRGRRIVRVPSFMKAGPQWGPSPQRPVAN